MVTMAIMVEYMKDCMFQYTPVFRGKQFSSLFLLDRVDRIGKNDLFSFGDSVSREDVLYICDDKVAFGISEKDPKVWVLGVAGMEATCLEQSSLERRLAFARSKDSLLGFYVRMQQLFLDMGSWQKKTHEAILAGEGVQKVLDIAEDVFNNYISLSNSDFELVARTKNNSIDDPKALELIKNGRHSEATIALFRAADTMGSWEKRSHIEETPPLLSGYPTLDYVYKRRGRYYMHLIMHCNVDAVSLGLADKFQMLVDLVDLSLKHRTDVDMFAGNDFSVLLEDIMLHRESAPSALERRARSAGISIVEEKHLMVFAFSDSQYNRAYLSYYARSITEHLPWCVVGIYGRYVVALGSWTKGSDLDLSLLEEFAQENPCLVGVSDAFFDIADLSLAFRQGKAVLDRVADTRLSLADDYLTHRHNAVFLFDDYFFSCVMGAAAKDDLFQLSARRGIVSRIAHYDDQHGTDDSRILFAYLKNERDARRTSEEIFVHRSTLLYRINRLQTRFAFDLDDCVTRQRLMLEYYLCGKDARGEHSEKKG